jgi:chitin disaccharide deacetylase
VLIVNCDDFGMHDAVNAAVVESIENGIASSCSLIVPCLNAADRPLFLGSRPTPFDGADGYPSILEPLV